jgi:hypothetical protein
MIGWREGRKEGKKQGSKEWIKRGREGREKKRRKEG